MAINIHYLANPARFLRLADRLMPFMATATVLSLAVGLYWSLWLAPVDYQQGDSVRIMFVHVPAAWMSMFTYSTIAVSSAVGIIWKHPLADLIAKASAAPGAGFTLIALVTGSLWGKPMWGAYWVWDARLTSMLILFFIYLGYIALWQAIEDPAKAARAAAILALVGSVNVPIIKFSVDWWNSLHQPASVFRAGGPTIDPQLLWPLFIMALGFTFYYVVLLFWRVRAEYLALRIRALRVAEAG